MLDRLTKLREERANSEKGFTLIELLVVVVIIGILIAIAIPLYLNYTKGASDKSAESDIRNAITAIEQCNSDNGVYPSRVSASGAVVGCTGNTQLGLSSNVTLSYSYNSTATGNYYVLESTNSNGTKAVYCYNSNVGGSIKKTGATGLAANLTACP